MSDRIRIGINTFLFSSPFNRESLKLLSRFKEMGFDGVEIALENRDDLDFAETARAFRDHGLACPAVCGAYGPGRDLRGTAEEQKSGKQYIRDCIDACVALGTDLFVGPHYSVVGRATARSEAERASDWKAAVANLKEVCAYGEDRGVYLALEPLNRFETDFINTTAQALDLIRDVGSPMLKVHLDTFHMNIEEKSFGDAVLAAGSALYHVHASENDRGTPGSGHIGWTELFAALKRVGYRRWIVIESFTPEVQAIARAASIWRDIEPSGEALATKGLRFLKDGVAKLG